ncbi:phosphate signaling complex protein PhoU [Aridibaculum aurantiacum]|uniref:phosphate signaling complex protein PhoU n=1 Tax=Aridibaculum aurantiacum TaxID=2810307 RepID=UPI001A95BA78|nr:phosphate signaling complex protein PhoU [Aridibaculum aurantiacum]
MTHLSDQLRDLRKTLSEMVELVKGQLNKSMHALFDKDEDLASEVLHTEKLVNAMELRIDRDCENIFALLTPVAHDMRFVFATLKINGDLERIGDYAEGISKLVILGEKQFDEELVEQISLRKMYDMSCHMLDDVGNAYINDDTKLARSVFSRDKFLNDINSSVTPIVEEYCRNHPDKIRQALLQLSIIRKLERVGDHITNIAEEIVFYKEAKVLKHGNKGTDNEI